MASLINQAIGAGRPKVADAVSSRLADMAARAEGIAEQCERALSHVSQSSPPCAECTSNPQEHYPELFDEYRSQATRVTNTLDRIEGALGRLEI